MYPFQLFHRVNFWLHLCSSWSNVLTCHLIPYNNLKLSKHRHSLRELHYFLAYLCSFICYNTCSLPVKLASLTRSPSMATFSATYFSSLKSIFIGTTSVFLTGPEVCAAGTNDWRSWRSSNSEVRSAAGRPVSRLGHHQYLARLIVGSGWLVVTDRANQHHLGSPVC